MERNHLSRNFVYFAVVALLSFIFLFLTLGSIILGEKSLTYDEPQHYRYGEQIWALNSDRFDDSKMPFSVLNVAFSKLGQRILGERLENPWQVMSIGRIATTLFSLATGIIVLYWASSLYGKWIGLVAFGLYIFEPNIIAHSRLITTDMYATGTITLTLFLFWRFLDSPDFSIFLLASLALGLCQIAKYTGLFVYPLLILLTVFRYWNRIIQALRQNAFIALWRMLRPVIQYSLIFLIISLLIINIGFLFNRVGTPLADFNFRSRLLQSTQRQLSVLQNIPVPVPYPYLEGLDLVLYNESTSENYGSTYMLGELRQGEGFAGYFFVASLFKIPIPILLLIAAALVDLVRTYIQRKVRHEQVYLLLSILFFSIYFNFFFRAQIGIRFFLVVFPVLLIFSVRIFRNWNRFSGASRMGFALGGIYLVVSVLSYFPHYLSYFNELILDRTRTFRVLADSNIDWGQNKAVLDEFLEEHPEYIFEPNEPTSGLILVGVNELTGVL